MEMKSVRATAVAIVLALLCAVPAAAARRAQTPQGSAPRSPAPAASTPAEAPAATEAPPQTVFHYRPVVRVGQDYVLRAGETAYEIQSVLADVTIEGRVDTDVVVTLGSVRLGSNAKIEGSLFVLGGSATIAEGATVDRDTVVIGGALDAPASFVAGGTQVVVGTPAVGQRLRSMVPWLTRGLLWGRLIVPDLRWIWVIVGIVFLISLVLNLVFDRPVRACADAVVARPLSSFLLGLFVLLLTPVALAIVGATVIGLAIVPFVLCALVAAAILGKIGVVRAIGGTITREPASAGRVQAVASFVIGFAVICLAYMVPIVGIVTWAITGALGLGAAAVTFRMALRKEHPVRASAPEFAAVSQPAAAAFAPVPGPAYDAAPATPIDVPPPPPLPAPGGLAAYPHAAFLDRVAAFALDCILVAIAVQVLGLARHDGEFFLWLFLYHVGFWAWRGTTMGGIVCGLRVIRTSGADLRIVDAVVRALASIFSVTALGIGCFWMLQDPERQMWHDKIAGTFVVKVPRELLLP
jgi:uncharacterized RDD family membrane protein YckC